MYKKNFEWFRILTKRLGNSRVMKLLIKPLRAVVSLVELNGWPFNFTIQYVHSNFRGPAKDCCSGRHFVDFTDFQKQFKMTFVRTISLSDSWDLLRNRHQGKDDTVMSYFQAKVRLCRDLSLSFIETRDHVIKGIYTRDLAMYSLSRVHIDENELLADMLEWVRMSIIRGHMPKTFREDRSKVKRDGEAVPGPIKWAGRSSSWSRKTKEEKNETEIKKEPTAQGAGPVTCKLELKLALY